MRTPIEYSSKEGGRFVQTAVGRQLVVDIRTLGCPSELVDRIERRNAERTGVVPSAEADALRQRLAAQSQIPVIL